MTSEAEPGARQQGSIRSRFRGYSGARPDVLRLIDLPPRRVLDVGCGAGLLGHDIRSRFPEAIVVGVESDERLAELAKASFANVINGSIESLTTLNEISSLGPFDLVICADVLEHLKEPLHALEALTSALSPNGRLITSIPNIRHVSTFVSLGLLGTWPTRDRGIHDRGHLRFFARRDILNLGKAAGLQLNAERRNLRLLEAHAWTMVPAKLFDFWPLRAFLTFQYLHRWTRRHAPGHS